MATSINNNNNNNNMLGENQPVRRGPGRRKSKNGAEQAKKKQLERPRRGMGVEKLERLINGEENIPSAFSVAAGADHTGMNMMIMNSGCGCNRSFQYLGGFGSQNVGHVGAPIALGHVVCGGHEISKELPSNLNSKKKRYNGVGNLGFGNYVNATNDNQRYGNSTGVFGTPNFQQMVPQVGYVSRPGQPGVEVLAVHKKGGSGVSRNEENGDFVMEYEFFPGCSSSNSSSRKKEDDLKMKNKAVDNELVMMMMKKSSTAVKYYSPEETCLGIGVGSGTTSTSSSIDLSLKLSYC